jgi:coproporphyrinogen III oxidase
MIAPAHEWLHQRAVSYFRGLQDRICQGLEQLDEIRGFREDTWDRPGGGGGRSRVMEEGRVFEKAGVNFSEVFGSMSPEFARQIPGEGTNFTATGLSLVIHPRNPHVPTVHMNYRFLTKGDRAWFGGGADLTPYYPIEADCRHFHTTLKAACAAHPGIGDYPAMKKACDEYFHLPHRGEARGVGGIFFDYVGLDLEATFAFVQSCGEAFLPAYGPIVSARQTLPFTDAQRHFQAYRRGRYVEFNLLYDRGTIFGLKTGGRIESILMSLPPIVRYTYDYRPPPGSPEDAIFDLVRNPRAWA